MSKKNIIIVLSCIIVFVFLCISFVFYYNKTTKLVLKCTIKGDYSHFGESLWETFHGKLDADDEYFLINLRKKTINDFDWKPIDTYKDVNIDEKVISMVQVLQDGSELNYIIYRNTGEISGIKKVEDKKLKTETFYNYEGSCTPYNIEKKF